MANFMKILLQIEKSFPIGLLFKRDVEKKKKKHQLYKILEWAVLSEFKLGSANACGSYELSRVYPLSLANLWFDAEPIYPVQADGCLDYLSL